MSIDLPVEHCRTDIFGDCTLIKDCLRGWEGDDGYEDFGIRVVSCADLGVGSVSGVVGGVVALG